MTFLMKSAFWLLILVLLIPTDQDQQNQIYGTAQTAMKDLAGFCDRNPKTCATGQDAFQVLVQKAQNGAQMIMALVEEGAGGERLGGSEPNSTATPGNVKVMPVPSAVPLETWSLDGSGLDGSQDTLNAEDRKADWGEPNV
ncbi:MAG: DUF5330 domain-containing protein [Methyloligellaceae bacterium]